MRSAGFATRFIQAFAFLTLASGGVATPAAAHEDKWVVPGSVYLDLGAGAERVNLPETESQINGFRRPVGKTDGDFWAETYEATLGFADGAGLSLPDPVGRNARIEFRARYTNGDTDRSVTPTTPIGFVVVNNPNLGAFGTAVIPTGITFDTDYERWDGDFVYQTDIIASHWVTIRPLLGLTYSRLEIENQFRITGFPTLRVDDELQVDYIGAALGSEFIIRPADFLELSFGLRADLMGADADLDVQQVLLGVRFDESDGQTHFASRSTASVGMILRAGPFEFGVEGFAKYMSYLPGIEHPTDDGIFGTVPDKPSHIVNDNAWSLGGMAHLTLWIH